MENKYPWAANKFKLERAIGKVGREGDKVIKEYYIKIGGLVLDTGTDNPVIEHEEPETFTVPTTRRGRPKKDA